MYMVVLEKRIKEAGDQRFPEVRVWMSDLEEIVVDQGEPLTPEEFAASIGPNGGHWVNVSADMYKRLTVGKKHVIKPAKKELLPGDYVRCISTKGKNASKLLVEGGIYRVAAYPAWFPESEREKGAVRLYDGEKSRSYVGGSKQYWSPDRFERVTEKDGWAQTEGA